MKNTKIKEFYKNLYAEMTEILKPYGFRKKGDRFRRLSPDGILGEVEIQRRQSEAAELYSFTVNLNLSIFDLSVNHDLWEMNFPMIGRHLGDRTDSGQGRQKWYDLYYYIHPHLQAQIVDGRFPFRYKEEGKDWNTTWIPVPDFEEITAEVCDLTKHIALPFLLSVQTKQEYLQLLKRAETKEEFSVQRSAEAAKLYAKLFGLDFLPLLSEYIRSFEDILASELSDDLTGYDEIYQQGQRQRTAMLKENIIQLKDIEAELKKTVSPVQKPQKES